MTKKIVTDADLADAVKHIIADANRNHLKRDANWKLWQMTPARMDPILAETKKLCDRVGYSEGNWETLTQHEQAEIAHELLTTRNFERCIRNLENEHASKTHVPAIDAHLNLKNLKNIAHYVDLDLDYEKIDQFTEYTERDIWKNAELDFYLPHDPEALTKEGLELLKNECFLGADELVVLHDFALKRGLIKPLKPRTQITENEGAERLMTELLNGQDRGKREVF